MGMGMLFAGALTGGARAVGEMADQAIKREDDAQVRQQSIMDRRNELLFEMKAKADMAQEQERADAEGYVKATERGRAMGDDRRFAKFREDIKTSGYGEGMGEDELRAVFEQNYNDRVVTDAAGGDRYYEPESADKRDALQAARSSGASGKVLSALGDEHRGAVQGERQAKQDADRDAREEQRRRDGLERDERKFEQQERLLDKRLGAQAARGGGGGEGPEKELTPSELKSALESAKKTAPTLDDFRGNSAKFQAALSEWRQSDDGKRAAELQRRYDKRLGLGMGLLDQGAKPSPAGEKPAAQKSAVKDNQTTAKVNDKRTVNGVTWVRTEKGWTRQ